MQSVVETLSDEVFFEIFDRLSPTNLYKAFDALNHRFNRILNDPRMRFRDNISSLNIDECHFYIENILPKIINRLSSFTFGTYDTDEYQQVTLFLHTYSIDLSHFQHLRTLVIINLSISDIPIIQSSIIHLVHLVNFRLSIDSNDIDQSSVIHINNNLLLGHRLKHVKLNLCARTTFENINKISSIERLAITWCQLQELTHLLQYTPQLCTLKASLCGLNINESWSERFRGNYSLRLTSLKLVIDSISFDHLCLFLRELTQLRALWLLLNHHEYLNVEKWENLFEFSLKNLDQLDLTIALIKPISLALSTSQHICEKFNKKFWFEKGWGAKLDEYDHCIRLIVSNNLMPLIKKARKQ